MTETPAPSDDLDVLLAAFYRSEMPSPWPRWQAPARRATPAPAAARTLARGRAVLTAAVVALVAGVWLLAGWRPATPVSEAGLHDSTATRPANWKLTGGTGDGKTKPPR